MNRTGRRPLAERLGSVPEATPGRETFAEVAVYSTFPSRQTFSYAVPPGTDIAIGSAVYVPFGKLTIQGVVTDLADSPGFSDRDRIRSIRSVLRDVPRIDADRMAVASWIADEYLAPTFDAVALFLPPGFERKPITVVHSLVDADNADVPALSERLQAVFQAIMQNSPIQLDRLREQVGGAGMEGALAALERRGLILREYTLARPAVSTKMVETVSLAMPLQEALDVVQQHDSKKRSRPADVLTALRQAPNQAISIRDASQLAGSVHIQRLMDDGTVFTTGDELVLKIRPEDADRVISTLTTPQRTVQAAAAIHFLNQHGECDLSLLRTQLHITSRAVRWLAEIGVVRIGTRVQHRDPVADLRFTRKTAPALSIEQKQATNTIRDVLESRERGTVPAAFLLHGVTGSGKTEVYLDVLEKCVRLGKRAIILVPEISLTPQTVRRFKERFDRVAVMHSGLTAGELHDQWRGVAAGEYDVVVGARSALFAPVPDLGLIVLDEEHEWTYKQSDPQPRYHARDVAIELARRENAVLVLGSATPDVATYHRALNGEFTLLRLEERLRPRSGAEGGVTKGQMPRIDVVDLREELLAGIRSMFSRDLQQAVSDALARDEQVVLFLNRRGLAGHVQCRDCGFVPGCGGCDTSLTFHRQYDRLVCHHCNKRWKLPPACKQCRSPRFRLLGVGVEKVEAEASRLFPHARLLRWDRDTTKARGSHDRILESFLAREADILIGTQMLAKGLDMPGVTVVGVMNADTALHLPDFRAGERTFQLLTQVAGRAGRGERPGRVIIQTYTPDHYAIDAASRYDYEGFVTRELESRHSQGYPPFRRLVLLTLSHANERWARDEAHRMQKALLHRRTQLGAAIDVIGPAPAYVPRLRGRWRWRILLKGDEPASLVREFPLPQHWSIDVDPGSLV